MKSKKERALDEAVERANFYENYRSDYVHPEFYSAEERAKMAKAEMKEEWIHQKEAIKAEKEQDKLERQNMLLNKRLATQTKKDSGRGLKNFGWWLFGLISFVIILGAVVAYIASQVPIKKIFEKFGVDSTEYVGPDIEEYSLLSIYKSIDEVYVEDVPAINLVLNLLEEDLGLGKYIHIDTSSMGDTKLVSQEMLDGLMKNLKIIATLNSLGMDSLLDMDAFKNFAEVPDDKLPNESSNLFNYRLYYYCTDETAEEKTYAPAFEESNGFYKRVMPAQGKKLYYPALNDVVVTDLGYVFVDRLNSESISSLLGAFGMDGGAIADIFEGKTVGDMANFDFNEVNMSAVFSVDGNDKLRDSLIDMTYGAVIDRLACDVFINEEEEEPEETETETPEPEAKPAKTKEGWNSLTEEQKAEYIATALLTYPTEPADRFALITVGDLTKAEMDGIKLKTVLAYEGNEKMYSILSDMTGKTADDLSVGDFAGADVDSIKFTSVLAKEGNEKMYSILCDMTGETEETLTVGDFAGADVDAIKLSSVLVYEGNEKMYSILGDMTGKSNEELTVGDFGGANVSDIKLSTVIDDASGNKILEALLSDPNVTVGNMSTKINELKVSAVYGDSVFVEEVADARTYGDGKQAKYSKSVEDGKDVYTLDNDNGTYYIGKEASIWLFMLYDCESRDSDGFGTKYTANDMTVSSMDSAVSSMSAKITGASIRQLVSAGILSGVTDYRTLYTTTLDYALSTALMIP